MSNLYALQNGTRAIDTQCQASWFGQNSSDWNRGVTELQRRGRLSLTAERIPGEGLLLKNMSGYRDIVIQESAWRAFAAGETQVLHAETGDLKLILSREDLASLLGPSADIIEFARR